jgi:plasmid stability protein
MASITLKSIPPSLHRTLKSRAKQHKRSLNQEVIAVLEQSVTPNRKVDVDAMLAREKRFSESLGFMTTPQEIEAAIQEGRRI